MNPFLQRLFSMPGTTPGTNPTQDSLALLNATRRLKVSIRRRSVDALLILLGVLSAGFGLEGFLLPNNFIDGGAVGISLLIAEVSGFPLAALLLIVNAPFVVMGYKTIGWEFALKTILAIVALSLAVALLPYPQVTEDKLLVAVFGGFFLGAGIGLAVRGGGVLDGTEVLAINMGKALGLSIGDVIMLINIVIFGFAAWLLSIETALYSMLTYLAASKTVDFVISGIEEYTAVTIVSKHSEEIRVMITEELGRGVTIYQGKRGYGKRGDSNLEVDILYSVITRLEVNKMKTEIAKIDPEAFVVMTGLRDTHGGMIKKRPLKH